MGHIETRAYNPARLDEKNWDNDIFGGVPLEYACEIAINQARDLGLGLNVWILKGSRASNTIIWPTNPTESKNENYFVLSDTVSEADFRAQGKRIQVELGSYSLVLPYNAGNQEKVQLDIYSDKLNSDALGEVKKNLKSQGVEIRVSR